MPCIFNGREFAHFPFHFPLIILISLAYIKIFVNQFSSLEPHIMIGHDLITQEDVLVISGSIHYVTGRNNRSTLGVLKLLVLDPAFHAIHAPHYGSATETGETAGLQNPVHPHP